MPLLDSLVPLMLLAAFALAFPQRLMARRAVRLLAVLAFGLLFARYYSWRLVETVLPAQSLDLQSVFIWALFAIETFAWTDTAIGLMALLRQTDRRGEADLHEARLRALPPAELPVVDVMIATYNEPWDVLEKTIVGALALDWPRERLRVWVLDDGRRPWLEAACRELGAGYLTRGDNRDAKAGNINAAIRRTSGEFFLVLDADFVPRRSFLYRAMGFFQDPTIGIVQIPHNFFNNDPMQSNLDMRRSLPDDQRFFFDAIMPGRDGWDCAFCCGSNGIVRRSAIESIGNALPSGSITEDMLLTMALLRKGYRTRYLNEPLAVGLAPEGLQAFFVQRARWARGAIQILFLKLGPLGPGLTPIQRLMFLPTHWISQSLSQTVAMAIPAIYLLTGLLPLHDADTSEVLSLQLPAILGAVMLIRLFAPWQYFPLAASVHGVLQAFRLLPTILLTLVKPHGHSFRVTPKGSDAAGMAPSVDWPTAGVALALVVLTALGLVLNASPATRIVAENSIIPVVAFWSVLNMVILLIVAAVAVSSPVRRSEERFDLVAPCRLVARAGGEGAPARLDLEATTRDLSLAGARLSLSPAPLTPIELRDWLLVELPGVGTIPGQVLRRAPEAGGGLTLGLRFHLPAGATRRAMIERLFTEPHGTAIKPTNAVAVSLQMIRRIFRGDTGTPVRPKVRDLPPEALLALAAPAVTLDAA